MERKKSIEEEMCSERTARKRKGRKKFQWKGINLEAAEGRKKCRKKGREKKACK